MKSLLLPAALLLLGSACLSAQWRTESFGLKAGYNAIYLLVDPGERDIESDLLAAYPQVEELWRWVPTEIDPFFISTPEQAQSGTAWRVWRRGDALNSTMTKMEPNAGYLVKIADGSADFNLAIKGTAVPPQVSWRSDGLNLLGFPSTEAAAPTLFAFLGPAGLIMSLNELYQYRGGPLMTDLNPGRVLRSSDPLPRGQAFWIRSREVSDYYGPLEVEVALNSDGLAFGAISNSLRLVVRNKTNTPLTATLTPTLAENAPDGTMPEGVPLTREDGDQFVPFSAPFLLPVPADGSVGLTIGIDRSQLTGAPGTIAASLLKVTDSDNLSEIYLPVTASVTAAGFDPSGLWVGEARINRVQNQLQEFQTDADGNYLVNEGDPLTLDDDKLILVSEDQGLHKTAQEFPLRLIIHVDANRQTRLLGQVYYGVLGLEADDTEILGSTVHEDAIEPDFLGSALRISAAHLPPEKRDEAGWLFGSTIRIGKDDLHNPFIHTYHPDHDTLSARFEVDNIAARRESHDIGRTIFLHVDSVAPEGVGDPAWGTTFLTGTYREILTGLHKNSITVEGQFQLRRLTASTAWEGDNDIIIP